MEIAAKIISFLAFLLACAWVVYSPGFDSGVAAIASLAAFFGSLFLKKKEKEGSQIQNISGSGKGVQAGRDANIGKMGDD